jgi:cytochrome c553
MSLLVIGIISISPHALADDMTVNRLLASQCAQCHGTDGFAVGDIDSLAGESTKDLIEDLNDMRNEDQPEDIMDHQALGYTEDQIRRIASYYGTIAESKEPESESSPEEESEEESEEDSEEHSDEEEREDEDED